MSAHRQHEEGKGDSFTYLGRVLCVRIVSFTRLCTVLLEGHRVVMFLNVTNQPAGGWPSIGSTISKVLGPWENSTQTDLPALPTLQPLTETVRRHIFIPG